jgi:G3E family GTPase
VHLYAQMKNHDEARKQVAVADKLLISKTDLVDPAELPVLDATLARINPAAEVFSGTYGAVDPQRLLAGDSVTPHGIKRWLERVPQSHDEREKSPHTEGTRTFSAVLDAPLSGAGLATWLSMLASLKGPQLLRVKGLVNVNGEPFVIDIVQSVVHPPFKLDTWPTADKRSRIVFIVRELTRQAIERTFAAFSMGDSLPYTARFDPEAYARFRHVADRFIQLEDVTPRQ